MYHGKIPVIDLELKEGETEGWLRDVGERLSQAFSTTGCAFLVNHGVSEHILNTVYTTLDEFYALPDDIKKNYQINPPNIQGYVAAGTEQLTQDGIKEMKHSFQFFNMDGRLPTEVDQFKERVTPAVEQLLRVTRLLLRVLAISFKIDPDHFLSFYEGMMKKDNITSLRMLYYPPVEDQTADNLTRCGEHTDYGVISFLAQDSDGGLEVKVDDEWCNVGHLPGSLLVLAADVLVNWTSSKYRAARHRVVIPADTTRRVRGRHSIAFFVYPDNYVTTGPSFLRRCCHGDLTHPDIQEEDVTILDYVQRKVEAQNRELN